MQIEKIQKQAAPEVVAAVKAGEISITAAATVASLPWEEQVAAAIAGKEELKQAAKRVRDARKKPATQPAPAPGKETAGEGEESIETLRQRVATLTTENMQLRAQLERFQREIAGETPGTHVSPL
jgi:predicted RNase H-like nuclease (RuvC/YqgF family)